MINKVVIMAAGKGTRMLNLSKDRPKHLIHVNNKPFLYYYLKNIKQAGYNEIILVVGYKKEKMEKFAQQYRDEFDLKLVDQFQVLGTEKYGTACPVEAVREVVGQDDFVVANGDDIYSVVDLEEIKKLDHGLCYAAGFKHEQPEHYGLLKLNSKGFLDKIIEKPRPGIDFDRERPLDNMINIGLYKFTADVFDAIDKIEVSSRGEYELTDALTILARDKKVKIFPIKDSWLSFTNPDDVAKIETFLNIS